MRDVLSALDLAGILETAQAEQLKPVLAGIRTDLFLGAKLLREGLGSGGWAHGESSLLQAAGDVSAGFPALLESRILPHLPGLKERLEGSGAAFLDIGAGVAALSVAMARRRPSLHVVAMEPWPASAAIARARIEAEGLGARIELRELAGEEVADDAAFDLVWIPSGFIPQHAIRTIAVAAARALRPGGWVLLAALGQSGDALNTALTRLRAAQWGGCLFAPGEAEQLLRDSGLTDIRALPTPPGATVAMIAARKA